jgi:glycosyltransferase involved in cell wall biosynthesis
MTKTIAFSWIFPLDAVGGGVERVTRRVMNGLSNREYHCLFVLRDVEQGRITFDGTEIGDLGEFLESRKVDTFINQNGYSSDMTELLEATGWHGRYIVCHHNEPFFLRKVYDPRGVLARVRDRKSPSRARLAWLMRLVSYPFWQYHSTRKIGETQARNYRRADRYVVLSAAFLPKLAKLMRQPELPKAVAIPNPLSFEIDPDAARAYEKRKEVLVVARLNDGEKRISAALRAWLVVERQDSDGWELKIIGDGPDAAALRETARALGLKRVTFLGHQDPLPHYQTAALFLMTSRVEGWGLTLTEAMQTRTVPIAFDAYAAVHDIIANGETGVIVPNSDVAALAEATLQLMADSDRRKTLAANGLVACQRFRLEEVLNQWEAIL